MEESLNNITQIINEYESGSWATSDRLRELLRGLTTNIYRLTKFNIEAHQHHNATQYKHKGSVAAGIILANEQYPELRMTRKIIESANRVIGSMTMELSILKKEQ